MIWQSIPLMTFFDIVIVIIVLSALRVLNRQRHILTSQTHILVGAVLVIVGLIGAGLFYLIDLFIMWGLPLFIPHPQAMDIMETIHLNYSWINMLLITSSIFFGFTYMIRGVFVQATKLNEEILEHKLTEKSLLESENRWKFALEGNRDGVWDWNVQTTEAYYSNTWKEMLGYEKDEIGNDLDEWEKRIHPDDKERVLADVRRHI